MGVESYGMANSLDSSDVGDVNIDLDAVKMPGPTLTPAYPYIQFPNPGGSPVGSNVGEHHLGVLGKGDVVLDPQSSPLENGLHERPLVAVECSCEVITLKGMGEDAEIASFVPWMYQEPDGAAGPARSGQSTNGIGYIFFRCIVAQGIRHLPQVEGTALEDQARPDLVLLPDGVTDTRYCEGVEYGTRCRADPRQRPYTGIPGCNAG